MSVLKGSCSRAPAFPGDAPRPAGRSGQGAYHIIAFAQVRVGFCEPSEWSLFPWSPEAPAVKPRWFFKSQIFGGAHVPGAGPLGLWVLIWGSELLLLWENLCNIIILQLVGCPHPGVMGFDYIVSLLLLLVLFWLN